MSFAEVYRIDLLRDCSAQSQLKNIFLSLSDRSPKKDIVEAMN